MVKLNKTSNWGYKIIAWEGQTYKIVTFRNNQGI